MKKFLLAISLTILSTGCSKNPIVDARTEYLDIKGLASVAVDTPDPKKNSAYWGEKLNIDWDLGNQKPPASLVVRIRLRNGKERRIERKLEDSKGRETVVLDAFEFNQTGGIVSYKVELLAGGKVLARSLHRLWVEPIESLSTK